MENDGKIRSTLDRQGGGWGFVADGQVGGRMSSMRPRVSVRSVGPLILLNKKKKIEKCLWCVVVWCSSMIIG